MVTVYPAQIDTTQSLPTAIDNITPVQGVVFNRLRDAVIAIEAAVGVNPGASYGSLAARLGVFENTLGNLQIIKLQKDIGGTLANPLVVGIQGFPVSNATPQTGNVLLWDGIAWIPTVTNAFFVAGGDLSGSGTSQTVVGLLNRPLGITAPLVGQVLEWNGSTWSPATG